MKLHEVESIIKSVTGLATFNANDAVQVLVTGDTPELVPVVREKLEGAGIRFEQSKHRKFKGATFTIPLRNVGTAFHANWEFA